LNRFKHKEMAMGAAAKKASGSYQGQQVRPYKTGGSVKHDDVAADRKLIKAELKKVGCMKKGGKCK
jgi:hypothetical protein